jgi:molybdopterin-containing oxidoreductase family membrane subunit
VGVFAHVDTTVQALEALQAKGYRDSLRVYTPVPVHEIEDVLERDEPVSKVRLFTLIGALTGTVSGFFLTIWSAVQWGLVTGGKFLIATPQGIIGSSIPAYVVIAFELTILFGGIATLLGMVTLARLPRLRPSPAYDPRFSADRFGIAAHVAPERRAAVREILERAGAEEVRG